MDASERQVIILGAGGHARVVADALRAAGRRVAAVVSAPGGSAGGFGDVPILTNDDQALELARGEGLSFIVAIGDNALRTSIYERFTEAGMTPATVVHPAAVMAEGVRIGVGSLVGASAVVNPGARIGRNAIVNTGAIVEHDCRVMDHAHIAPGVRLGGTVSVGSGALVGIGAIVLPNTTIGAAAIVGAGAVVTKDVADAQTVVGVPARTLEGSE